MMLRAFFLALVLTGCSGISPVMEPDIYTNYMSFEHPFTDEAEAVAFGRAEKLCQQRKQAVIRVERVCSLAKCVTSYQCVPKAGAATSAR